ncbi:MAG: ATP-binding protein [Bacteriovoracia bacterium]
MIFDFDHTILSWKKRIGLNLILIIIFFLLAEAGHLYNSQVALISPMWVSSGISLGVILIFGVVQATPGIVIGNLLLTSPFDLPGITSMGLGLSKIIEVLLAFMLLISVSKGRFRLNTPKDIFNFVLLAGFLAPFVSSTVSVAFTYLGGFDPELIPNLWIGNYSRAVLGILVFTPLVLSFFDKSLRTRKGGNKEAVLLFSILAGISYWAFESKSSKVYLIIPILTWAALRFSFRGMSVAAIIVSAMAIWRSEELWLSKDLFEAQSYLFGIQCMIAGISIVGYFMSTVGTSQQVIQEREIELTINRRNTKIAEEALAILDQSLHKSPMGFALIDKDYRYIRINETLAKINGVSVENHIGKTIQEVVPSIVPKVVPLINRVFETGESLTNAPFQGHLVRTTGEMTSGLVSYYPIRHPSTNEVFAVAFSFQDVTQLFRTQTLLRENQERLTFAQEAGKIGAFEWCLNTQTILWTPELEQIYGLGQGEFGGLFESWMKWVHPEDVTLTKEEFEKVIKGEKELNHEFRIITKAQDVRWILARGKMVEEGNKKPKLIGINIDLTEQKNYEQKLRLTEANLLHALSVRDEFVATASHELKTPLTSLKLQIQMFQRGLEKSPEVSFKEEKVQGLLDKNIRQLDRLTRLVDDMLDISRIRTGKLSLKKEQCDLTAVLNEILNRMKEQFETSGSGQPVIECMDHASGEWDSLRIEQVLTNILSNAIRYGQGKPITLSVKNYQESVRITVKDQGLGIPKSDQYKIFEKYERGLLRREVSGLGLGLFITQQIIEAHGGKIWVESEVNNGAAFFVELPRMPEQIEMVTALTEKESLKEG